MFGINLPWLVNDNNPFFDTVKNKQGWILQVCSATGHARIIDPNGIRRAWGDRYEMDEYFDYIFSDPSVTTDEERCRMLEELIANCRNNKSISDL